jgi:ElaB/YqjD/DUF883 family membrane-anchored ribosome-binding protein
MAFSSLGRTQPNKSSANDVGDNVAAMRTDITNLAESVKHLATERVQDKAREKLGDVEAAIRRNPTQASLVAVGIGFAAGLILSR